MYVATCTRTCHETNVYLHSPYAEFSVSCMFVGLTWCRSTSSYIAAVVMLFSGSSALLGGSCPVPAAVFNLLLLRYIPVNRPATYDSAPTRIDITIDIAIGTESEQELATLSFGDTTQRIYSSLFGP